MRRFRFCAVQSLCFPFFFSCPAPEEPLSLDKNCRDEKYQEKVKLDLLTFTLPFFLGHPHRRRGSL